MKAVRADSYGHKPKANVCTPASRIPYSRCKCLHSCTPASRYNSKYWMNNLYNKIILRNLTAASATRNGGTAASACRRPKAWQARYLHGKRTIHYLNQTFDNYVHTQNGRTRHQRIIRKTKCSGVSEQNVPFFKTKRTSVNLFPSPSTK